MRTNPATLWLFVLLLLVAMAPTAAAQVSPEEHAKHHPKPPASGKNAAQGEQGGMMGGEKGGMGGVMGGEKGGMGGGMGSMMEKMGAPKPKELYPRLMGLPDLPMEERARIQQEAHERMIAGTRLLSDGLEQLSEAASGDDFAAMQAATAILREGLAQFESGLAAQRAIAEGKAPRNVALQWFKRETNLLPPAGAEPGFRFFGMSAFHTAVMAILIAFTGAMIWMYFFKMRRASELLQKLATPGGPDAAVDASRSRTMPPKPSPPPKPPETSTPPIAATATFHTSGKSTQLLPDETLLEAAERGGVEIEYSCRTGMCGACAVKLLSGQVTMETDDGLDPDDRAAGKILACQAKPVGDVTVEA